jgi:multiple sugar transport system permease protein
LTLFFTLFIFLLSAFISQAFSEDGDKILIKVMSLPPLMETNVNAQASRAIVRSFMKRYPQYKLEPFETLNIGSMNAGPLMSIATGNAPDAVYVKFRQSSTYINHGFLEPMEVLLARVLSKNPQTRQHKHGKWLATPSQSEINNAVNQILARVVKPVWPVIYRKPSALKEGLPTGKHIWALPYETLAKALLYRKDIFKEAGLDPERPPRNWNEFLDYARRIKALPNKYGFMYPRGPVASWGIFNFMAANGVRYMNESADGEWHAAFNTMAAAETIYYVLRLTSESFEWNGKRFAGAVYAPMGMGESNLKWRRGEIGMQFSYLSFDNIHELDPALMGVAPIPKAPNGKTGGELNCRMLGVFSGASLERQLGAIRYIWHLTGEDAERVKTKMYVDAGYGKFLRPDVLKAFGYEDILRQIPKDWKRTTSIAFEAGVPEPYGKNTQRIYIKTSVPINWALNRPELLKLPKKEALREIKVQLDVAAARVDKFMLGKLTKEEWNERRFYGSILFFVIFALFAGAVIYIWRVFTNEERLLGTRPPVKRFLHAYLMLLPALALVLFVQYLPLLLGTPLALLDFELLIKSSFVGIDNFATILYDSRFWASMVRTFYYVLLVVGLGFWPPILVAILLDEVPTDTLKYIFRTIFYLPTIVSGVILVFLWRQLYEPSESGFLNQILMTLNNFGPITGTVVKLGALLAWFTLVGFVFACAINLKELSWPVRGAVALFSMALFGATLYPLISAFNGPSELMIKAQHLDPSQVTGWNGIVGYLKEFFGPFHIKPFKWIEDPGLAMVCCVIPMVWATAGPGCIIYLAALKTVPEDLVEAATIDGAGLIQKLSYITLPRVKFLILIQLLGAIVGAFKGGTDFIIAMTGGGPNGATRTMGLDIFERSFIDLDFGMGTAMGWVLGALVVVLTIYQLRKMSKAQFTTATGIKK